MFSPGEGVPFFLVGLWLGISIVGLGILVLRLGLSFMWPGLTVVIYPAEGETFSEGGNGFRS